MKLNIVDDTKKDDDDEFSMEDERHLYRWHGTELMNKALYERVDNDLLDKFYHQV